jgi:hypothetical protein
MRYIEEMDPIVSTAIFGVIFVAVMVLIMAFDLAKSLDDWDQRRRLRVARHCVKPCCQHWFD